MTAPAIGDLVAIYGGPRDGQAVRYAGVATIHQPEFQPIALTDAGDVDDVAGRIVYRTYRLRRRRRGGWAFVLDGVAVFD